MNVHNSSQTAIIIVTYKRPVFLKMLLTSIENMTTKPEHLIVVDNASGDETPDIIAQSSISEQGIRLHYFVLDKNAGGSGGFRAGLELGLKLQVDWFWLMDDDVEILPDGLAIMQSWQQYSQCFIGRRYDYNGNEFHWQPRFNLYLGVPLPYLGNPFADRPWFATNCGCFEGMFIHRNIVEKIGLPDQRFFITWDDVIYGWLASHVTEVMLINAFVIKRIRQQRQINLGIRHLNDANNVSRYYVMANRGHVAQYLRLYNCYHPAMFAFGTFLVLAKEILRLIAVERSLKGCTALFRGMRQARKIRHDKNWSRP
ncbi:glycosyltransferase [Pseudochrobactrum sp. HB0163]|uniref:glycosyltransferase n=1 Tax=Pseudochrobactrum sp. HB0163 TaxID=3450708 RepID=UPI003F6DBE14